MVPGTDRHPYAAHARSGRQVALALARRDGPATTALRLARRAGTAECARIELPAGAAARTVDRDGRFKLTGAASVTALLDWEPGALAVAFDGPWALLTQGPGMAGAPRRRNGSLAQLVRLASGVERICLAPAHVHRLGVGDDRVVLMAPVPATGGLLVVAPTVALAGAPARFLTGVAGVA